MCVRTYVCVCMRAGVCGCVARTSILGDVSDPRQRLVAALLDDLEVAYLWREREPASVNGTLTF